MEAVENVSTLAGFSLLTDAAGASYGMGMINLKAWEDRSASVEDIIAQLEKKTGDLKDASIEFFPPPTVPGFGNSSGFELRLLARDKTATLGETAEVTNKFIEAMRSAPEVSSAFTNFDPSFPQYMIHVDQDMAAKNIDALDYVPTQFRSLPERLRPYACELWIVHGKPEDMRGTNVITQHTIEPTF